MTLHWTEHATLKRMADDVDRIATALDRIAAALADHPPAPAVVECRVCGGTGTRWEYLMRDGRTVPELRPCPGCAGSGVHFPPPPPQEAPDA